MGLDEPGIADYERVHHIPQSSSLESYQLHLSHIKYIRWTRVLPLCRDTVGVSYSPSQMGSYGLRWNKEFNHFLMSHTCYFMTNLWCCLFPISANTKAGNWYKINTIVRLIMCERLSTRNSPRDSNLFIIFTNPFARAGYDTRSIF